MQLIINQILAPAARYSCFRRVTKKRQLIKHGKRKPIGAMRKLKSSVVGIDHGEVIMFSDFQDDGQMWRGTGPRKATAEVSFETSYTAPPHV